MAEYAFAHLSGLQTVKVNSKIPPRADVTTFYGIHRSQCRLIIIQLVSDDSSELTLDTARQRLVNLIGEVLAFGGVPQGMVVQMMRRFISADLTRSEIENCGHIAPS